MDAVSLRKLSQSYSQKRALSEEFWIAFFNDVECSLGAGKRCLDLGCGSGRILLPLAERFPDVRFLGIDVSVDMLLQVRAAISSVAGPKNIDLAQGRCLSARNTQRMQRSTLPESNYCCFDWLVLLLKRIVSAEIPVSEEYS